jgi:hypothetical protein
VPLDEQRRGGALRHATPPGTPGSSARPCLRRVRHIAITPPLPTTTLPDAYDSSRPIYLATTPKRVHAHTRDDVARRCHVELVGDARAERHREGVPHHAGELRHAQLAPADVDRPDQPVHVARALDAHAPAEAAGVGLRAWRARVGPAVSALVLLLLSIFEIPPPEKKKRGGVGGLPPTLKLFLFFQPHFGLLFSFLFVTHSVD